MNPLITSSCPLDTQGSPTNLDVKSVKNNIRRVSQLEEGYILVHPRSSGGPDCSGPTGALRVSVDGPALGTGSSDTLRPLGRVCSHTPSSVPAASAGGQNALEPHISSDLVVTSASNAGTSGSTGVVHLSSWSEFLACCLGFDRYYPYVFIFGQFPR